MNIKEQCDKLKEKYQKAKPLHEKFLQVLVLLEEKKIKIEEVNKIKSQINELFSNIKKVKTKEGKEVEVDFEKVLKESAEFFIANGFPDWAEALPKDLFLNPKAEAIIVEAMERGCDRAIIFPDIETQGKTSVLKLKENLADKEIEGLSKEEQYTKSYFEDESKSEQYETEEKAKEKRKNPYVLMYSSEPIPQETKGMKYPEVEQWLKENNWDEWILSEFYFAERKDCQDNKKHGLFRYDGDEKKSNRSWVLGTRAPGGRAYGYWSPNSQQVNVNWRNSGMSSNKLGVRPAAVAELS